jgi:integrase/recombinase XerD
MSKKAATFTTHLLDSGTDLRYNQEMLGEISSNTKEIQTHISQRYTQIL